MGAFVSSGDTGRSEAFIAFARGADVLLAMCRYRDGTPILPLAGATAASDLEVARIAAAAGISTLVLTHLSAQFDDALARANAARAMAAIFPGTIVWGEDLMTLDLGARPEARLD